MTGPAPVFHRYCDPGFAEVNTYWVEAAGGVIVIDGQRSLSQARRALGEIQAVGKPILAVFLTHPHPDHFGGIGVFSDAAPPGTPIYSSRVTRESIEQDRWVLVKASRETMGADFPARLTLPDRELVDGQGLEIGGVRLVAHEMGAGEAECVTVLHLPEHRALFSADVVQDGMTPYLLEGRSGGWLRQIEAVRARFPAVGTIYPGHGRPGPAAELLDRQAEYLRTFRHLVASEEGADGSRPSGAAGRVVASMRSRYPGYQPVAAIPDLLDRNVEPLVKELRHAEPGSVLSTGDS